MSKRDAIENLVKPLIHSIDLRDHYSSYDAAYLKFGDRTDFVTVSIWLE